MSPLDWRRRRRRRVSPARLLAAAGVVLALVVLAVLLGGVLRIGSSSTAYWRSVDRSYAVQIRALATQSNEQAAELAGCMTSAPSTARTALQATLDTLVRNTQSSAQAAQMAAAPSPYGVAGGDVTLAFDERAQALADIRRAIDGLLQMTPLPVVGSPDTTLASNQTPLSASAAATDVARAGTLLAEADRDYAEGRRDLRTAPGHARLVSSAWSRHIGKWSAASAETFVAALATSPDLSAIQQVALLTNAVALTPPPVPPAASSKPAGTTVVPPTHSLSITAVVADQGTVAARGLRVTATAEEAGGSVRSRRHALVDLTPGGSVAADLPALAVTPGGTYTITVAVARPPGEQAGAVTSDTFTVAIAPPAPPTVASLTPTRGRSTGGTLVTILGTGFTSVTSVDFGAAPGRFTVVSKAQIDVTAPAGSGTVPVTVTNAGGTSGASPALRFTYTRGRPAAG